jgi:heat shock protein HtpX
MLTAQGLYGHIRNNNLKSAALLVGFLAQFFVFTYAITLVGRGIYTALKGVPRGMDLSHAMWMIAGDTLALLSQFWFVPVGLGLIWFAVAYAFYQSIIRSSTRARDIDRKTNKDLYNLVENLAITAGLPMPRVQIMETMQLNAYAAGLTPGDSVVAVTRGLLQTLSRDELEAVLAHELTHIKNRDVRLMIIASIFAGLFTLLGTWFTGRSSEGGTFYGGGSSGGLGDIDIGDDEGVSTGLGIAYGILAIVIAILLLGFVHISAIITHFAISRKREFLADAGATELTKNPDALINALRKITGHDAMPHLPDGVQAMMISRSIEGLLSTHPSMDDRVSALMQFAGGRITTRASATRPARVAIGREHNVPVGSAGIAGHGAVSFGRRQPRFVGA